MDQSVNVRQSIGSLQQEGLLGALLAGLVVLLFLRSWRATLITIAALPIAVLAAFIGLYFTGNTVNSMTLGGLALSMGILVDQAIVVVENIARHLQEGRSRWEALREGVREVILPVTVATATFLVVFFPVIFLSGMARYLFQPLAMAVSFAMLGSYFAAMIVVSTCCSLFLRVPSARGPGAGASAPGEPAPDPMGTAEPAAGSEKVPGRFFQGVLGRLLRMKHVVLLAALVLFAGAVYYLARASGTELFPQVDSKQLTIYVRLPSGTRIEKTEETIQAVEQMLVEEIGTPDPEYPKIERHPDSNLRILISNAGFSWTARPPTRPIPVRWTLLYWCN